MTSVGYDADTQVLEIEMRGRGWRVYRYNNVPELVFHRFLKAASLGEFFNAEIRDRYPCERLAASQGP
jgi:hypothetical protein